MPHISLPEDEQKRLYKEALKEALREWLDDQFATFGKWSAAGIASLVIGGLAYVAMTRWRR
jgi:hypothetical protein